MTGASTTYRSAFSDNVCQLGRAGFILHNETERVVAGGGILLHVTKKAVIQMVDFYQHLPLDQSCHYHKHLSTSHD